MITLDEKFRALEADSAPGQEVRQETGDLNTLMRGEKLDGTPVDFSQDHAAAVAAAGRIVKMVNIYRK